MNRNLLLNIKELQRSFTFNLAHFYVNDVSCSADIYMIISFLPCVVKHFWNEVKADGISQHSIRGFANIC